MGVWEGWSPQDEGWSLILYKISQFSIKSGGPIVFQNLMPSFLGVAIIIDDTQNVIALPLCSCMRGINSFCQSALYNFRFGPDLL